MNWKSLRLGSWGGLVAGTVALLLAVSGGFGLAHLAGSNSNSGGIAYFVPQMGANTGSSNSSGTNGSSGVTAPQIGSSQAGLAPQAGAQALYPYEYGCQTTQGATTSGHTVTATGYASINPGSGATVYAISISLSGQNGSGSVSLASLQARVDKVVNDLIGAGVPANRISTSLNSYLELPVALSPGVSGGGAAAAPAIITPSATGTAAKATAVTSQAIYNNTSANIEVTVDNAGLADQVGQIATQDGASYVSLSGEQAFPEPDSSAVQAATDKAVASAHDLAAAAANSAGSSLAGVFSLVVTPPSFCGGYGYNQAMVVSVTVIYTLG